MSKKLVSAIVSTYNSEKYIRQKLEDLLAQTIINETEIIVVNSGSQQNEESIVEEFMRDHPNIKYIRTDERETIYKAWNRGIRISEGAFITNSNTDDRLRKDAFEVLSGHLLKNPDIALVYADQVKTDVPNQRLDEVKGEKVIKFLEFNRFVQFARFLAGSQPMWRSSLHFKDNFWFDEKFEIAGDYDFHLRISEKYKMLHLPYVLGTFYKDMKDKSNKEYQDIAKSHAEGRDLAYRNILKYFQDTDITELEKEYNKVKIWTIPPYYLYLVNFKIRKFLIPDQFNYSLEFIYLVSGLFFIKKGNLNKALNLYKKFLKNKKSDWIEQEYKKLKSLMKNNGFQKK